MVACLPAVTVAFFYMQLTTLEYFKLPPVSHEFSRFTTRSREGFSHHMAACTNSVVGPLHSQYPKHYSDDLTNKNTQKNNSASQEVLAIGIRKQR